MKILHLNRDSAEGGAARGAARLVTELNVQGTDARLYVQRGGCGDIPHVTAPPAGLGKAMSFARRTLESLLFGLWPGKVQGLFSTGLLPDSVSSHTSSFNPDIVHLHWVARMMHLETLRRFRRPVVWTLHDSWPFTGGCFLPLDCIRYEHSCGRCPVLGSSREEDLSRRVWLRKKRAWENLNLTIVGPSRWMLDRAQASSLFRNSPAVVIPNGLDTKRYKPGDPRIARAHFSLPQDKKLILFGAKSAIKDTNKGFHLLTQALNHLRLGGRRDAIELIIFGSSEQKNNPDLRFKAHYLGWQQDEARLALLYGAADAFVLPSIQENLPYTVMEAMACGTPCIAFNQGGVPDLIDHEQNGYLARPFDTEDLAHGITRIINDDTLRKKLSVNAREKVEHEFALEKITQQHLALYQEILNRK